MRNESFWQGMLRLFSFYFTGPNSGLMVAVNFLCRPSLVSLSGKCISAILHVQERLFVCFGAMLVFLIILAIFYDYDLEHLAFICHLTRKTKISFEFCIFENVLRGNDKTQPTAIIGMYSISWGHH